MSGSASTRLADDPTLVLVVDDNEANLALFERVLSGIDGVSIRCVSDPRAAEEIFGPQRPDLVILDLHMPFLSGMDLLDVLAARVGVGEFLPFLMVTADSSIQTRHEVLSDLATQTDPIDVVESQIRVDRALETRRLHLQSEAERSRLDRQVVERTAELAVAREDLRTLAHSKDRFLAAVAHELRTPLTAVLGFARELAERVETLDPDEITELASIIAEQSTDMAARIDDCLVAARSRIDKVEVLNQPVDVQCQLDLVIGPMSSEIRSRITRPATDMSVVGDTFRVRQILRNLIQNAATHGGHNISVETEIDSEDWVEIRVIDDGAGVSEDQRPFMFTKPLEISDNLVEPGSIGLGLFVSSYLAQLMGGDLAYRPGDSGAVFVLRLPGLSTTSELRAPPAQASQNAATTSCRS